MMERIEQALVGRMEQLAKELDGVRTNCSESNTDADAKVGVGQGRATSSLGTNNIEIWLKPLSATSSRAQLPPRSCTDFGSPRSA